jgi:hypothetical protein
MSKEIFESHAEIWLIVHNEYGGKMGWKSFGGHHLTETWLNLEPY